MQLILSLNIWWLNLETISVCSELLYFIIYNQLKQQIYDNKDLRVKWLGLYAFLTKFKYFRKIKFT